MKRSDGPNRTAWWRIGISVLILGHLWAVIGRPLEFATQGPTGPSPAASSFYAPVRGYSEATYLNHGYAFFAPNPGPSHLLRVETVTPSGDRETYLYPDRRRQWPRLLYHRHFMLTEFLHTTYHPQRVPPEVAVVDAAAARWKQDRQRYEAIRGSMRRHLQHVLRTDQLALQRVEHRLAGLPEFLEGRLLLDDPQLYIDLVEEPESWPPGQDGSPQPPRDAGRPSPELPRFGVPSLYEPAAADRPRGRDVPRGELPGSGR